MCRRGWASTRCQLCPSGLPGWANGAVARPIWGAGFRPPRTALVWIGAPPTFRRRCRGSRAGGSAGGAEVLGTSLGGLADTTRISTSRWSPRGNGPTGRHRPAASRDKLEEEAAVLSRKAVADLPLVGVVEVDRRSWPTSLPTGSSLAWRPESPGVEPVRDVAEGTHRDDVEGRVPGTARSPGCPPAGQARVAGGMGGGGWEDCEREEDAGGGRWEGRDTAGLHGAEPMRAPPVAVGRLSSREGLQGGGSIDSGPTVKPA